MRLVTFALLAVTGMALSACVTTSIQGYADRDIPARPIQHIAAYVAAPGVLASNIQARISEEASKRGVIAEDALQILPPTRKYTDAEIRKLLNERGVDGVLLINVGDTGVISQYAGTIFHGSYSGSSSATGTITNFGNFSNVTLDGSSSGVFRASATPVYRYSRRTDFSARLIEPASARNLWIGKGQVNAGGALFVGDGVSSSQSISAIFEDLQSKGLIGGAAGS
jgi:hypothetical protein